MSLPEIRNHQDNLILNVTAFQGDILVQFDALERVSHAPSSQPEYIPITFVHYEKIATDHKLILAFCASVLASHQGVVPLLGKILYGDQFKITTVKLETLINKAREISRQIADLKHTDHAPPLRLNKQCMVCEFNEHCEKVAVERDDLSLLRALSEKDIDGLKKRGIFSVTQYSYTFTPRRKRKRAVKRSHRHYHCLQALAVRTNTIYEVGGQVLLFDITSARKAGIPNY